MNKEKIKKERRARRHARIRASIFGTKERPRLSVFKSDKSMYLQLIDDRVGKTLLSAHSREIKLNKKSKESSARIEASFALGKLLAERAVSKKIKQVVFDRGGYKYHGLVKAAADGVREGGLIF